MRETVHRWLPAAVLAIGCVLVRSIDRQRPMPLRAPLAAIAPRLDGFSASDTTIGVEEQRVAGMSAYLLRFYRQEAASVSLYVGYYDQQTQGRTIHSPRNCLPGAGWEAVESSRRTIPTAAGAVVVNRYLLANKSQRALVYYWYQGRGRVEADEYRVKLDLMRDAALLGHTEEALVRIVVPLGDPARDAQADALAQRVAAGAVPEVAEVLPS
jgi:EpsI family protein